MDKTSTVFDRIKEEGGVPVAALTNEYGCGAVLSELYKPVAQKMLRGVSLGWRNRRKKRRRVESMAEKLVLDMLQESGLDAACCLSGDQTILYVPDGNIDDKEKRLAKFSSFFTLYTGSRIRYDAIDIQGIEKDLPRMATEALQNI